MTPSLDASASTLSALLLGTAGYEVTIEARVVDGPPGFDVLGLPGHQVRELRDRLRAAILASDLAWPLRRVSVTLTPLPASTSASALDVAVALAVLAAAGELPRRSLQGLAAIGELGLDGSLRPVAGIVPLVEASSAASVIVPAECHAYAELAEGRVVRSVPSLRVLVDVLRGTAPWPSGPRGHDYPDEPASDLAGLQYGNAVRRAIEVSAAGGHYLLLVGPPGSDAAAVARCVRDVLPPLSADEALETLRIRSAAGLPVAASLRRPPFRAPHPSSTPVAVVGGRGLSVAPGELSLAHNGVLLLDDIRMFDASVLRAMRTARSEGHVLVSRAGRTAELPARVLAVAIIASCPCHACHSQECRCAEAELWDFTRALTSGFIDPYPVRAVLAPGPHPAEVRETTVAVARRVAAAREAAVRRGVRSNADLPDPRGQARLTRAAEDAVLRSLRAGRLSPRAADDVRKVGRTIADLDSTDRVEERHVLEALLLRFGALR